MGTIYCNGTAGKTTIIMMTANKSYTSNFVLLSTFPPKAITSVTFTFPTVFFSVDEMFICYNL